jgi:hypothetical protein
VEVQREGHLPDLLSERRATCKGGVMKSYFWEDVAEVGGIGCLVILVCIFTIFLPLFGIATAVDYLYCQDMMDLHPDHDFNWGVLTGCRVQMPSGIWLDTDDLKYIEGQFVIKEE